MEAFLPLVIFKHMIIPAFKSKIEIKSFPKPHHLLFSSSSFLGVELLRGTCIKLATRSDVFKVNGFDRFRVHIFRGARDRTLLAAVSSCVARPLPTLRGRAPCHTHA